MNKTQIRKEITAKIGGGFLSFGNAKLPKSHMILNLSTGKHCPSAILGFCHCVKECYARRDERLYKNYYEKNKRVRDWLVRSSEDEIFETLYLWAQTNTTTTTHIRLNECGDFHNQHEVDMWSRLAERFEAVGIQVYAWSSRKDLDFSNVKFAVQGSRMDMLDNVGRVYYCVDNETYKQKAIENVKALLNGKPKPHALCQCAEGKDKTCKGCGLCNTKEYKGIIYTKIH